MKLPIFLLVLASFGAQAHDFAKVLDIEINASKNTTAVVKGKRMYVKSFDLSVISNDTKELELSKKNGCFFAEDENGIKYSPSRITISLLGTVKPNVSKEGTITFMSDNKKIYDSEFVFWEDNCNN